VYLIIMGTLVATRCKSVQVVTDYLLAELLLGEQMFLLWGQRAKGNKLAKLLHTKNRNNFGFVVVYRRSGDRD
jgi:hypothetical protein